MLWHVTCRVTTWSHVVLELGALTASTHHEHVNHRPCARVRMRPHWCMNVVAHDRSTHVGCCASWRVATRAPCRALCARAHSSGTLLPSRFPCRCLRYESACAFDDVMFIVVLLHVDGGNCPCRREGRGAGISGGPGTGIPVLGPRTSYCTTFSEALALQYHIHCPAARGYAACGA